MVRPPVDAPPSWSIGDKVVHKPMYGRDAAAAGLVPIVYEVRAVDGDAVWLRRPSGHGYITVSARWIVPAPKEGTT